MKFGVHVSIAGSISKATTRAEKIRCDTFQIFTRNPRSWLAKDLDKQTINDFISNIIKSNMEPIFAHMPYLPNLASNDKVIQDKSLLTINNELKRCNALRIPYLVTHLGSSKSEPSHIGERNVIKLLNSILNGYSGNCEILLENTASKNQNFGANIEIICGIVNNLDISNKVGLCFDTCHAFASGYDLRKEDVLNDILKTIDDYLSLKKLKLIHCNDSKFALGEGRDRHEHIGLGEIGKKGFTVLLSNKELRRIPFICETPVDDTRDDKGNLEYLRNLLKTI